MTREQINALRENACGCPCHTEPRGFCLECCGPGRTVLTRLLDEREALLDAMRGIRAVEIILSAPNVGASFLIADKAIALAEAP